MSEESGKVTDEKRQLPVSELEKKIFDMAKAKLIRPIEEIHGKLKKEDDEYYRWRNGRQFVVKMENPRTKFSEKEKALRSRFGELSKRASEIAKDPEQAARYMADFEAQKDKEGGKKSLYHYVLAQLTKTE